MMQPQSFAVLLERFIQKDGRHVRQLSEAISERFGPEHAVPHNTISRWLRGEVQKPRNWPHIVKLAAVLRLSQDDMHRLLQTAGHDGQFLSDGDKSIPGLFDQWSAAPDRLPPFQVPPRLETFTGRQAEISNLSRYLCSRAKGRVGCLLGMAGLGKTSLAIHLAYQLRDHFSDGVLWVSLDQTEPMPALLGIATAYDENVLHYTDLGTRSSKVRELLASKNALLILDNASDDQEIRPLLPPAGDCAVLITSRRHDLTVADRAYRLSLAPFDVHKAESMALFRQIIGPERVQAEQILYQQIADSLGHLPLAVNIIANRLLYEPGWTAAQLLARLQQAQQRLNLLVRGDQQVRLSFALSYQALNEDDRQLFSICGLFPGSFAETAVATIAEQPLWEAVDGLRRLYSLSLVLLGQHGRYQLHPLLRDFSREQPQPADLPRRFVHYFLAQAHAQDEAVLELELSNIVTALAMATQVELTGMIPATVNAIYPYLQRRGQLEQAQALLEIAEPAARALPDKTGLIEVLHHKGYTAMKQGQPDQAEAYYQEALALTQELGDDQQRANILLKLGALAYRRGQLEEATNFYREALALARARQDQTLIASLLVNLGLVMASKGTLAGAVEYFEEALPLARESGDRALTIAVLQNLGNVQEERGDYAQAKTAHQEGLVLAEAQGDPELRSRILGNLGTVAGHLGNHAEAAAHFRAGLALAESHGLSIQIYRQQANLGYVAMLRGQFRSANTHYREALTLARKSGFPEDLGMILNQAGDCYLLQDAYQEAVVCYTEALEIANIGNFNRVGPLSEFGLAKVAAARGNVAEARRLGQQSREQLAAIGHQKANEVWWWLQELPGDSTE